MSFSNLNCNKTNNCKRIYAKENGDPIQEETEESRDYLVKRLRITETLIYI